MNLKDILLKYPDAEILKADGFDDAVIGINEETMKLVYSVEKCVEILMAVDGMEHWEAREYLDFNSIGAYVGELTPIWLYFDDDEGIEEGELCNRDSCMGLIKDAGKEGDGCSCHNGFPPCSYCTQQNQYCDVCGWEAENA